MEQVFYIDQDHSKQKIDKIILSKLKSLSRRKVRRLLDSGKVFVNGVRKTYASTPLQIGDKISVHWSESCLVSASKIRIKDYILYEDEHTLVFNKLPGLVCDQERKSYSNVLKFVESGLKEERNLPNLKLYLCHRLDKDTSGALILAKNKKSCEWVIKQFRERAVKKTYLAICRGLPKEHRWEVRNHLSKISGKNGFVRPVHSGGKHAITIFRTLSTDSKKDLSLIECRPLTGRSHQIRSHLSLGETPILGDLVYDNKTYSNERLEVSTHCLHAKKIEFIPYQKSNFQLVDTFLLDNFSKVLEATKIHLGDI